MEFLADSVDSKVKAIRVEQFDHMDIKIYAYNDSINIQDSEGEVVQLDYDLDMVDKFISALQEFTKIM